MVGTEAEIAAQLHYRNLDDELDAASTSAEPALPRAGAGSADGLALIACAGLPGAPRHTSIA
jgi:hypothetical protein